MAQDSQEKINNLWSRKFKKIYIAGKALISSSIPTFKMEMYKSQNEGFILNLIKTNPESHIDEGKLFILNDIENLGRDIQYILAMEILKK